MHLGDAMAGTSRSDWVLAAVIDSCRDRVAQCACQLVGRPRLLGTASLAFFVGLVAFVAAAGAQPPTPTPTPAGTGPSDICTTNLAETIRNMILLIQFGGPLIGGLVGAGAMVLKPVMRGEDMKRKLKQLRDGAIIWGVVAAPLFVTTIQYVVTGVVVGAPTCSII